LTFTIAAKNDSQSFTGEVKSTGSHTITVADPALAHTVPAGKTEKIHVSIMIQALQAPENIRLRIGNNILIKQWGVGATILNETFDLGVWVLVGGNTVVATTSNAGTEGAIVILTAGILESVPS